MKAKEWAKRFSDALEASDIGPLSTCIDAFAGELATLITARCKGTAQIVKDRGFSVNKGTQLASVIDGAIREQRQKWDAIVRLCPRCDAIKFEDFAELISPSVVAFYQAYDKVKQLKKHAQVQSV